MSKQRWQEIDDRIPKNYDRYLGPFCFEPFGREIVGRVTKLNPKSVLELASGTGVVTQLLAEALPSDCALQASDLNADMLALAKARTFARPVEFRIADACELPFESDSFDVVACQFGWMFFPDKLKAAQEARRVLKPGGLLLFDVWDSLETCGAFFVASQVAAEFFPKEPPRFLEHPFGFHDRDVLRALLQDANFSEVGLEQISKVGVAPSAADVARGIFEGTPMATAIAERDESLHEPMIQALAARLAGHYGEAPLRSPLQAILCSGRKPQ